MFEVLYSNRNKDNSTQYIFIGTPKSMNLTHADNKERTVFTYNGYR